METHACVSREQAMRRGGRATRRWGVPLGVLLACLAVVALLPLDSANGAPPQYGWWTYLGPDGGTITALAIDPLTPATMYAGTTVGLFRSPDGGQSWTTVGYLGLLPVTALAIAPTSPTTVYVGTPGGVYKSTDGGAYWQPAYQWLPNVPVMVFAIDPTTPTTLYAGTDGAGVFKSTDGGASWQPANSGLGATAKVRALVLDPLTPTTLYAGTAQYSQTPSGIFKSTDGGASWQEASAGLPDATVTALALDPTTPTTLYAGTYGGFFKSTDGGTIWQPANSGLHPIVTALVLDPTTPSTLYAGSPIGVFRSLNGGASWQPANSGMPPTAVNAFALLPTTPTTLYVGTAGGGIFKSTDGGPTWQPANSGLMAVSVKALAPDSATPGTLYTGTDGGGIFKSTDGGPTWQPANSGLAILQIRALALDPTTPPGTLYAGTYYGGVFKSTDGGGSWQPANTGLTYPNVTALALDRITPTTLYAGTSGGGVFKSTDGGGSWAAVNTGLINLLINTVILDPAKPTTLYAGSSSGVWRSQNAGATWQVINTGLTYPGVPAMPPVATLAVDPQTPGGLYAGTSPGGIFKYSPDPRAEILTPLDGSTLPGASVTFTWSTGIGVTEYQLAVGTTPGGTDIYNASQLIVTSVTVPGLPTTGVPIHVRLTSVIGGIPQAPRDYSYTAVLETAAEMLTPTPGSTLAAPAVTFTWSPGTGVTQYWLRVGTTLGAGDLFSGGTTATALPVTGLPETDQTLHVRLESLIGAIWQVRDYTYTASGSRAALLTPHPNSVLTGASVTFTWSPGGTGVTAYWLDVGTSPGRGDLYSASQGTATSRTVSNLPLDGRPVFVRLWSYLGSAWQAPRDYTYTAADTRASMLTPTPGTTLSGASVTFTWSAGTGVTEYWLAVGTSPGMGDLYSASQGAAASATVAGLPTDGRFLYVRLESRVGGVWQTPRDYPYRAAYLTSMLTVRIAGSSDGSVRSTPSGITCTTECNGWFLAGTVVVLTASPGTGGTFREWRGGCTGTAPSCMVTLGATLTVTAVFSKPFTDPTPKAGVTPIKAVHFTELREAINTLRIRYHLPAFTWSQTPPARGMLVTRTPLLDLRTALDQAYTAASRTHAAYTDSAVIAGTTPIRAVHLNELRTFVRNLE